MAIVKTMWYIDFFSVAAAVVVVGLYEVKLA